MMQAPVLTWSQLFTLANAPTQAPTTSGIYEIWRDNGGGNWVKVSRGRAVNLSKRLNEHRLEAQRLACGNLYARWALVHKDLLSVAEGSVPKGIGDTYELEMESEMEMELANGGYGSRPASGRWTRRGPGVIVIHLHSRG